MNKNLISRMRWAALTLGAALLVSCARTPVPQLEATDIPVQWRGAVASDAAVWPNTDWWTNFGSDELVEFIELVKSNNFDYATNLRNLEQAQIALVEANLALYPSPSGQLNTNASTSVSQVGDGPTTRGGTSGPIRLSINVPLASNVLNLPLSHQSALNQYESQLASTSQAALNTLSQAASAYFDLLYLRDQIEASRLNLEVVETSLEFTRARVDAGIEIPLNRIQQEIQVRNTQLQLERQLLAEVQARAALALLVGRSFDNDFDFAAQTLDGIVVPEVQPGLPAELLTRRPDLVQAEINLRNAAINVDRARNAFLPSISLSSSIGTSSPSLIDIVSDPAQTSFSLSASLAQQLFDNGGRKRQLQRQRLTLETQLANYRRTVIQTFIDINNSLDTIALDKVEAEVVDENYRQAQESERLARVRYEAGTIDFLDLLNAQNTLFNQRNQRLNFRRTQLRNIMNLYVALGGGWEAGEVLLEQPEYAAAN